MTKTSSGKTTLSDRQPNDIRVGKADNSGPESIYSKLNSNISHLGLDISSTSTGWAVMGGSGNLEACGVIVPLGDLPVRLKKTKEQLQNILNKYQPTFVGIEDMIAFKFGRTAKILNYFNGVAYLTCYEYNGNEPVFIASSSLKKMLGVNPMALKKEGYKREQIKDLIYEIICKEYGQDIATGNWQYRHDIADAISCAKKLCMMINNKNANNNYNTM